MRAWPVPIQISDEERIIGGYFSLRQLMFIVLGFVFGGLGFALFFLPMAIKLIFFMIISCFGFVFAFYKKDDLRLDQYLFLYFKWKRDDNAMYLKNNNSNTE